MPDDKKSHAYLLKLPARIWSGFSFEFICIYFNRFTYDVFLPVCERKNSP